MKLLNSILTLGVLFAASSQAATIYSNGAINGATVGPGDAWTINFGFVVSDSFTANGQTATGFDIGAWVFSGDSVTQVDWAIGTTTYGSEIASGTATLTNTFQFGPNSYSYDIYVLSGSLPNVVLGTGTYWFTLQNAVVPSGDPVYWDENDGPSAAFENSVGSLVNGGGNGCANGAESCTGSQAFNIYGGASTAAPEPGTISMIGAGLFLAAGLLRRKARA